MMRKGCRVLPSKLVYAGVDAAALGAINEGDEGGTVAAGADVVSTSGCFPGIWTPEEFEQYLNGTLVGEYSSLCFSRW